MITSSSDEPHSRFHLHFTPTSGSLSNLIERRFCELLDKALRGGVLCSVPDPIAAIHAHLETHSEDPKPFI